MKPRNPYEFADELAPALKREIQVIFSNAALRLCSFDEINQATVKGVVGSSFSDLTTRLNSRLRRIIRKTYRSHGIILSADELTLLLAGLLNKPDPVTGYKLVREIPRKRDRLAESIMSDPASKQHIRRAFEKALDPVMLMSMQYLDIATDDSNMGAMKRENVAQVMWVSERDERVCETCKERDGMIFDIDRAPYKPHYRCRCHLEPVTDTAREDG